MSCTATLTTVTVTLCPKDGSDPDGLLHFWNDSGYQHLELHTLTCDKPHPGDDWHEHRPLSGGGVEWSDDTPGATPHVPAVEVSPREVEAAARAWVRINQPDDDPDEWATLWTKGELSALRAALVAAKQATAAEVEA